MNTIYWLILGLLALLAVFDLTVGVANDAANFLNSAMGCRAAKRRTVLAFAAVGVLLGASFSGGMMEIARNGVFNPAMFSFHDIMVLFLAVMLTDVLLLDGFNTLGLPTSTTVSLVFELLGAGLAVALFSIASGAGLSPHLADYINSAKALAIISGIFCSVAVAFTAGVAVMWFSRLVFSFRYQRSYQRLGALWCAFSLTVITWFTVFKGMKHSSLMSPELLAFLNAHLAVAAAAVFALWFVLALAAQHLLKLNVLKVVVLCGTAALAFAFAGNDLVNFIGVFMAAEAAFGTAMGVLESGGSLSGLRMSSLAEPVQAQSLYLVGAGLIMVLTLCFSRKARRVTDTEIKLSNAKKGGKERFGSILPARLLVRYTLRLIEVVRGLMPACVARFIGQRFAPAEVDDTAAYDLIRGSVNLTLSALLISLATSFKLPLSTTYVTFMVAMGSALADRAWGRGSAVYRITGVLTVIGGWFLTAALACAAAFLVATALLYGGLPALVLLPAAVLVLMLRSARRRKNEAESAPQPDPSDAKSMRAYAAYAEARLDHMLGMHHAAVEALLRDDVDSLKRLRKESKALRRSLEEERESIILPALQELPADGAERGEQLFRSAAYSLAVAINLQSEMKAAYRHTADFLGALPEAQGDELRALAQMSGSLAEQMQQPAAGQSLQEQADALNERFSAALTRHLMHRCESEVELRNSLLFLTLLNETRAMVANAVKLRETLAEM